MIEDVEQLIYASTIQDVWDIVTRHASKLGFPFIHYTLNYLLSGEGCEMPSQVQVLTTLDPPLAQRFREEEFRENAPLNRWLESNYGEQSWDWAYEQWQQGLLTPTEQKVLHTFLEAGHLSGWGVSLRGIAPRLDGSIVFGGPRGVTQPELNRLWARQRRELSTMAALAHVRISSLPAALPLEIEMLTQRQREVLEWISAGKSNAEVAEILNISLPTVEKHLRLARQALGARSTAQATVLATLRNQIFAPECRPAAALSRVA